LPRKGGRAARGLLLISLIVGRKRDRPALLSNRKKGKKKDQ